MTVGALRRSDWKPTLTRSRPWTTATINPIRRRRGGDTRATPNPVPEGWSVDISPSEADLRPGESVDVTVILTAPDGFVGRMAINVNAFEGDALRGGVTLVAEGVV